MDNGGIAVGRGAPNMHNMSGIRWAWHIHLGWWHGSSQDGMVMSRIRSLCLPTFISVKHLVLGWANSVFVDACVALLCWWFLNY